MKYSNVVENFLRYLESIDRSKETIKGYKKELGYFGRFLEKSMVLKKKWNKYLL